MADLSPFMMLCSLSLLPAFLLLALLVSPLEAVLVESLRTPSVAKRDAPAVRAEESHWEWEV
jgi:hypothetical protein